MSLPEAFTTSKRQDYQTPPEFLHSFMGEFVFTLDAAAGPKTAVCSDYFSEERSAFDNEWNTDGAVWLNPPYSDKRCPVSAWVQRAWIQSRKHKVTVVILLPLNKLDQPWFSALAVPFAEVRIVVGRIQFLDPDTGKPAERWDEEKKKNIKSGNSQGSVVIIFGPGAEVGKLKSHKWRKV